MGLDLPLLCPVRKIGRAVLKIGLRYVLLRVPMKMVRANENS